MIKSASMIGIILFITNVTMAQVAKGDREFQFSGSFFTTTGTDVAFSSGNIQFKIGSYVTDNIEIGVAPTLTISTTPTFDPVTFAQENETNATLGLGFFGTYSFLSEDAKSMPYFGLQWFIPDISGNEDPITGDITVQSFLGINGGIKYFITEQINIDFGANYLTGIGSSTEGGTILLQIGLGIILPKIL